MQIVCIFPSPLYRKEKLRDRHTSHGIRLQFVRQPNFFSGTRKKELVKRGLAVPETCFDQSQRRCTTFFLCSSPLAVANDLFSTSLSDFSVVPPSYNPFPRGIRPEITGKKGGVARATRGKRPVSSSSALWLGVRTEIWVTEPRSTLRAAILPVTCCISAL